MPYYDYRCETCGTEFEVRHGFNDPTPPCPKGHAEVKRLITTAPTFARGILTESGSRGKASKEQLHDKWAEETPRLRQKLVNKLGEDTVNRMAPSLNANYD